MSHQKLQHVEALGDKEHIKRNKEKYDTLAEKTREMGYKVSQNKEVLLAFNMLFDFSPALEMNNKVYVVFGKA